MSKEGGGNTSILTYKIASLSSPHQSWALAPRWLVSGRYCRQHHRAGAMQKWCMEATHILLTEDNSHTNTTKDWSLARHDSNGRYDDTHHDTENQPHLHRKPRCYEFFDFCGSFWERLNIPSPACWPAARNHGNRCLYHKVRPRCVK